jgi:hypothetical protein
MTVISLNMPGEIFLVGSIKMEPYLNGHFDSDGLAIAGSGIKTPPLNSFHGVFIEAHAQSSLQPDPGNVSGFINNDVQDHGSLILGLTSLHGKLGRWGIRASGRKNDALLIGRRLRSVVAGAAKGIL